jgi:hypothetical protein
MSHSLDGGARRVLSERWQSQIEPTPGGEPTTHAGEFNGLRITGLDAAGCFAGQSTPGMPAQPPIEDARLLALMRADSRLVPERW